MKKTLPVVLLAFAALLLLAAPKPTYAQRGGGHGGGGFHGGGFSGGGLHGGSAFRGGSGGFRGGTAFRGGAALRGGSVFGGGFRGGAFPGYRGGWGYGGRGWGWGGRGWGWGGWGWGWGLGWGWPYYPWPGYGYYPYYDPYSYGYWSAPPYGYDPYSDPYGAPDNDPYYDPNYPPTRRYPGNRYANPAPPSVTPRPNDSNRPPAPSAPPAKDSTAPSPNRPPNGDSGRPVTSTDHIGGTPSASATFGDSATPRDGSAQVIPASFQPASHSSGLPGPSTKTNAPLRPEVQNAIRALREMPPFAREREINSGRYSHFTAAERNLLRTTDYSR